ncbi:MAG: hypothetical protein Q8941_18505 [Bacteroidota bacterium]|nr:hypothetical protein [Bacteroidota bacterium]
MDLSKVELRRARLEAEKPLKRVGIIKYVLKFLFMKSIKIAMAALVLTAGLVASFAFTTTKKSVQKPFSTVTYLYDETSNIVIAKNQTNSIDPAELDAVATWDAGTLGSHGGTVSLKAIQFESTDFTGLQQAIDGLKDYYATHTLSDNLTIQVPGSGGNKPVTVFTMP